MISAFKITILGIILLSLLIPSLAKTITIINPLEWDTIEEVIAGIIDFIFLVALAIAPLMIIIAAFFFITSAGDPGKVKIAKDIILWTVIGFTIVLLAKGIVSMVLEIIGG